MTLQSLTLEAHRSALLTLQSVARRLSHRKPRPAHLLLGERGEFEALFHLRRQGYLVIERRWRSPDHNGDLDLIAWEGPTLCFIEVKTRAKRDLFPASFTIDDPKRTMIRRMGRSFLRTLPREHRDQILIRCDVVSVYLLGGPAQCELLRDAFPWREPNPARYGV